jgi:hypothetical protein
MWNSCCFVRLFQRHNILLLLSSKRLVLIVISIENFSTHLFAIFIPSMLENFSSSPRKPRPPNFHFRSRYKVSSHCCNVSLSISRLSKTLLSSTLSTHIHNYYKTIPYFPLHVSCENFLCALSSLRKKQLTHIPFRGWSCRVIVGSHSKRISSFFQNNGQGLLHTVCAIALFPKKKYLENFFFLTLTIRRRFVTLSCLLTRLVE